jgi:hypothetical protein
MKLLINKGANVKAVDKKGKNLLDQVLSPDRDDDDEDGEKQFEIFKYLHSTQTIPIPLEKIEEIVANCSFHTVAYFLNSGFDPCFISYPLNQNILHIASQNIHPNFLSELINYLINERELSDQIKLWLVECDEFGNTPLLEFIVNHIINNYNSQPQELKSTISTLLRHGSNIFHRDVQGMGVLHHFCEQINDDDDHDDDEIPEDLMQHVIAQIDLW